MLTVDDPPSSVAYLAFDATVQELTLASSCAAVGPAARAGVAAKSVGSRPSAANAVRSLRFTCPPRTGESKWTDEGERRGCPCRTVRQPSEQFDGADRIDP